jgi:hypothetical protein
VELGQFLADVFNLYKTKKGFDRLRSVAHEICGRHSDVAGTSLIETWIDETERCTWFLADTLSEF